MFEAEPSSAGSDSVGGVPEELPVGRTEPPEEPEPETEPEGAGSPDGSPVGSPAGSEVRVTP